MVHQRSMALYLNAKEHLSGGVSSNFRLHEKPSGMFFDRAEGSRLFSVDGMCYIDYALGMGPVILGHAHPAVNRAVADSLARGQLYAGQHAAEAQLAKLVCGVVPCAEQVRFSLSGSEAIQAALRLARAYTGRTRIIKFQGHYHGWFDSVYTGVRGEGTAESEGQDAAAFANVSVLPWNNLPALATAIRSDVAAVIMEPVMCNTSVIFPCPGYLEGVRALCSRNGTVLIFDEVITGFRLALSGAQSLLGVTPDLAVFAKAMANGFPVSCLAGKARLMDLIGSGRVMHGGTYNSNVVSTAAALATLEELSKPGVYDKLNETGNRLIAGLRSAARETNVSLLIQGAGSVFHTAFTDAAAIRNYREHTQTDATRLAAFVEALATNGVRITRRGTWFLSAAHTQDDLEATLGAAARALRACQEAP